MKEWQKCVVSESQVFGFRRVLAFLSTKIKILILLFFLDNLLGLSGVSTTVSLSCNM